VPVPNNPSSPSSSLRVLTDLSAHLAGGSGAGAAAALAGLSQGQGAAQEEQLTPRFSRADGDTPSAPAATTPVPVGQAWGQQFVQDNLPVPESPTSPMSPISQVSPALPSESRALYGLGDPSLTFEDLQAENVRLREQVARQLLQIEELATTKASEAEAVPEQSRAMLVAEPVAHQVPVSRFYSTGAAVLSGPRATAVHTAVMTQPMELSKSMAGAASVPAPARPAPLGARGTLPGPASPVRGVSSPGRCASPRVLQVIPAAATNGMKFMAPTSLSMPTGAVITTAVFGSHGDAPPMFRGPATPRTAIHRSISPITNHAALLTATAPASQRGSIASVSTAPAAGASGGPIVTSLGPMQGGYPMATLSYSSQPATTTTLVDPVARPPSPLMIPGASRQLSPRPTAIRTAATPGMGGAHFHTWAPAPMPYATTTIYPRLDSPLYQRSGSATGRRDYYMPVQALAMAPTLATTLPLTTTSAAHTAAAAVAQAVNVVSDQPTFGV